MTHNVAGPAAWEGIAAEEEHDPSLGPEDYAWLALFGNDTEEVPLPALPWIWDRSPHELAAHLIRLAALRPLGSA